MGPLPRARQTTRTSATRLNKPCRTCSREAFRHPRTDADLHPSKHLQAIANTAAFHFPSVEAGGTSLYPSLAQRVTDAEVLRIVLSIGGTEAMHFQTWQDKAGNAPAITDPTNGLTSRISPLPTSCSRIT